MRNGNDGNLEITSSDGIVYSHSSQYLAIGHEMMNMSGIIMNKSSWSPFKDWPPLAMTLKPDKPPLWKKCPSKTVQVEILCFHSLSNSIYCDTHTQHIWTAKMATELEEVRWFPGINQATPKNPISDLDSCNSSWASLPIPTRRFAWQPQSI